jgi:hypothetical protein
MSSPIGQIAPPRAIWLFGQVAGLGKLNAMPEIELLWWNGCPSTERALAELREALEELGLGGVEVRTTEIRTDDDARGASFTGSPTILIDGADVAPPVASEPSGLNCRIYHRRDGRISPTPDPDDIRDALRRALVEAPQ